MSILQESALNELNGLDPDRRGWDHKARESLYLPSDWGPVFAVFTIQAACHQWWNYQRMELESLGCLVSLELW